MDKFEIIQQRPFQYIATFCKRPIPNIPNTAAKTDVNIQLARFFNVADLSSPLYLLTKKNPECFQYNFKLNFHRKCTNFALILSVPRSLHKFVYGIIYFNTSLQQRRSISMLECIQHSLKVLIKTFAPIRKPDIVCGGRQILCSCHQITILRSPDKLCGSRQILCCGHQITMRQLIKNYLAAAR